LFCTVVPAYLECCSNLYGTMFHVVWNRGPSYLEQNRWPKKAVQSLKSADALSVILFFKRTESVSPIVTFACVWAKCLHGERISSRLLRACYAYTWILKPPLVAIRFYILQSLSAIDVMCKSLQREGDEDW